MMTRSLGLGAAIAAIVLLMLPGCTRDTRVSRAESALREAHLGRFDVHTGKDPHGIHIGGRVADEARHARVIAAVREGLQPGEHVYDELVVLTGPRPVATAGRLK
jgi:hypothetical protein